MIPNRSGTLEWLLLNRRHVFIDRVEILEWPGDQNRNVDVPESIYPLLDHMIGVLFMNAVLYGNGQVRVRCTVDREKVMTLHVIDNGPGFDPSIFDDQSTNLHWRRIDAQAMSGGLTMSITNEGTDVCLVVSLKQPRLQRRPWGTIYA